MLTVENLMNVNFGEASSEIKATFKKTVLIRQYETEVVEIETRLQVEENLTGAERVFISAILQAQLEYYAYSQLKNKGLVTEREFNERKQAILESISDIKDKAEQATGKSMDKYLNTSIY